MHRGELEFHLVSDGIVWVDPGGPFGLVPRALYRRIVEPNQNHLIPQSLTCMLVRSEGKTILIDTGLGPKLDPKETNNWGLMRAGGGLVNNLPHNCCAEVKCIADRRGIHPTRFGPLPHLSRYASCGARA